MNVGVLAAAAGHWVAPALSISLQPPSSLLPHTVLRPTHLIVGHGLQGHPVNDVFRNEWQATREYHWILDSPAVALRYSDEQHRYRVRFKSAHSILSVTQA